MGIAPQNRTLIDVSRLTAAYYDERPRPFVPEQRVAFGTSGHRGTSLDGTFTEAHILAITQAICRYRKRQAIDGPLFIGRDTHALSEPALRTATEVLTANDVGVLADAGDGYTPTPAVSHAILQHNHGRTTGLADGIVITPSHNPPEDGGFKYNPPNGGPADTGVTGWIQDEANRLLADGLGEIGRAAPVPGRHDYVGEFCGGLAAVVDVDAIRGAGLKLGVDPLGGSSVGYWPVIAERWGLDLEVVND